MGDATNFILIFAGELLKKAEHLLVMGLHPSEVTQGYDLALTKTLAELESESDFIPSDNSLGLRLKNSIELSVKSLPKPLTASSLAAALKPAIASKQYGSEDILANLVAEAALNVMPSNLTNFDVDNIRVVKIMGSGLSSSRVVRGMVFGREPEG